MAKFQSKEGHTLRPYQREFITSVVSNYPHVATFDDMGLGKTIQCIAADAYRRYHAGPGPHKTLVVAPLTGVIDQWVEAFNSWQPHLTVRRVNPKKRYLFLQEEADVYIIHPEGLRLEADALSQINWLHFIFDECHRIKNRKTKTAKAAVAVGKQAQYRTGATGTPIENRADEMWHILKWLYPDAASRKRAGFNHWTQKLLASYWRFYERFTLYEEDPWTGYHTITGTKNESELRELFGPLYVRRYKQDVAKELPDKQYQKYHVDLLPKQRKAYNAMRDQLLAWVGENEDQPVVAPVVIAQLIRLQQFTLGFGEIKTVTKINVDGGVRKERQETRFNLHEPSVKLDALMDILDDLGDKQAVIFTTSKQAVALANARFEKAGISAVTITGDIGDAQRTLNIKKHQRGEAQVLVATIRAGGVGINLQHCDIMVFLDRDWSPAKNKQAEDRLHRIGQKNTVHIIDIVARNTIDQRKDDVLQKKWSWIRNTVGTGE
jgi:SNF2 family DNA or RNA helicase